MCNVPFLLSALSEDQKNYQELARKFAKEEILPKAAEYDRTGEVYIYFFIPALISKASQFVFTFVCL